MYDFDLIVIGGGSAGEKGAVQAAYFGKRVALIEKEPVLGGAMVNTGTLPSKTLRETALYLSGFRQRGLDGVQLSLQRSASVDDFLYRLEGVVADERARMNDNLKRHKVEVITGAARFVDSHTVEVAGKKVSAAHFLIATGSCPNRPALYPFDDEKVYDSDEIVRVHALPKRMAVVGAGVIGCEYACLFAALGARVTLVEPRSAPLTFLDTEICDVLRQRMESLGVTFRMPAEVEACTVSSEGVQLKLKQGAPVDADLVLVCAGRQGNTAGLNLDALGLVPTKRGHLEVDAQFRTKVTHISAAGDVIGIPSLASTSMEQARVAVVHMFDLKYKTIVTPLFPYGIYTIPEVSMCGDTEEQLKEKGVPYVKGVADFAVNSRGQIIGDDGRLKLLFHKEDMRLLGVHCIGEGATELIHIGLVAMHQKANANLFIDMCFNYPTLSEAYKYATYDALGRREVSA